MLSREEREVWRLDEYWGDDNRSESGPQQATTAAPTLRTSQQVVRGYLFL